jgi:hypothetical protein
MGQFDLKIEEIVDITLNSHVFDGVSDHFYTFDNPSNFNSGIILKNNLN